MSAEKKSTQSPKAQCSSKSKGSLLILGVDPSINSSGYSYKLLNSDTFDQYSDSGVIPIYELGILVDKLKQVADYVEMCIESPQSSKGFRKQRGAFSLKTVQAARNQWEKAVKSRWPRKNKINRVTPPQWRKIMMSGHSVISSDPKDAARYLTGIEDHNEAEAMLILEYWLGIR